MSILIVYHSVVYLLVQAKVALPICSFASASESDIKSNEVKMFIRMSKQYLINYLVTKNNENQKKYFFSQTRS